MAESDTEPHLHYSVRLLRPFLAVLREVNRIPAETFEALARLDPDDRIPISVVHDMLGVALTETGDPDLGLKAARNLRPGDVGAADYFWGTSNTVRDGLIVASRSTRLLNDALDIRLEERGAMAHVKLESRVTAPRAAIDFAVAGIFSRCVRAWLGGSLPEVVVSFAHAKPASTDEYVATFAPAKTLFSQEFVGFSFDRRLLECPLPDMDPKLHRVMSRATEMILADLPRPEPLAEKVRQLIMKELVLGNPSSNDIAQMLGMGERTLSRHLGREGTHFRALRDEARRALAMRLVADGDTDLAEIAHTLGFSQPAAFHRAFRRWAGRTPRQHRTLKLRNLFVV